MAKHPVIFSIVQGELREVQPMADLSCGLKIRQDLLFFCPIRLRLLSRISD